MKIIRTKPIRKDALSKQYRIDGVPLIDDKTCRVCKGARKGITADCIHCDENGHAKRGCGDCGEVLPGCKCVRMMGHCLPPERADEHPQ